jgi:TRAP-type C4-dicarboxylate transport system permease small subunit
MRAPGRRWLQTIEGVGGHALSWGLLLVVLVQVTDRSIFAGRLQLAWTEEIARIALVWYAFWGAMLVQREGSHIRLEFLDQALSARGRRWLHAAIDALVAAFLLIVVITAVGYAWHEMDFRLPATGLRRSIFVLAVVVTATLMLVHTIRALVGGAAPAGSRSAE